MLLETGSEYYLAEWQKALVTSDYKHGLSIALQGYQWALSKSDEIHEKMFLCFLKLAIDELFKLRIQHAEKVGENITSKDICSFCGKRFESTQLVHGVNVSICSACIQLASDAIRR